MSDDLLHKLGHIGYEAADLLFGIKAIEHIAKGQGTWGDAANLGVTAASFFFPPAKLFKFAPEAVNGIAHMGEKLLADEASRATMSPVAIKQLEQTVAHAKKVAEIKALPEGEQGRAWVEYQKAFNESVTTTNPGPVSDIVSSKPERLLSPEEKNAFDTKLEESISRGKAKAKDIGEQKQYSRIEDPTYQEARSFDAEQASIDAENAALNKEASFNRLSYEDKAAKEFERAGYVRQVVDKKTGKVRVEDAGLMPADKVNFTPEEIRDRYDSLHPYVKELLSGKSAADIEDFIRGAEFETISVKDKATGEFVKRFGRKIHSGNYSDEEIVAGMKALTKNKEANLKKYEQDVVDEYNIYKENNMDIPEELAKKAEEVLTKDENIDFFNTVLKHEHPENLPSLEEQYVKDIEQQMTNEGMDIQDLSYEERDAYQKAKSSLEQRPYRYTNPLEEGGDTAAGLSIRKRTGKELVDYLADISFNRDRLNINNASLRKKIANATNSEKKQELIDKFEKNKIAIEKFNRNLNKNSTKLSAEERKQMVKLSDQKMNDYKAGWKRNSEKTDVVKPQTEPNVSSKPSEITIHSGMADGADSAWAEAASSNGIKTMGHTFKGHSVRGQRPNLEIRNELSDAQLKEADVHLKKANESLQRPTGNMSEYVRNLLRRNYYQIKDSEAVLAVSKILSGGKVVDGGTGWAVQMGIDMGKKVYVYDQEIKTWAVWTGEKFKKLDGLPPKFKSFAGIGSRKLTEDGRKAINEYVNSLKGK